MPPRLAHLALNCTDLATTTAFYATWFGFHPTRTFTLPDTTVVFLTNGAVHLELFHTPGRPPPTAPDDGPHTPGHVRHLAFQVDDLDDFLTRADGKIPITLGPLAFDEFIPGWRSAWLQAPDNITIEVTQGYRDS
jgi:glyoxylase I family protein